MNNSLLERSNTNTSDAAMQMHGFEGISRIEDQLNTYEVIEGTGGAASATERVPEAETGRRRMDMIRIESDAFEVPAYNPMTGEQVAEGFGLLEESDPSDEEWHVWIKRAPNGSVGDVVLPFNEYLKLLDDMTKFRYTDKEKGQLMTWQNFENAEVLPPAMKAMLVASIDKFRGHMDVSNAASAIEIVFEEIENAKLNDGDTLEAATIAVQSRTNPENTKDVLGEQTANNMNKLALHVLALSKEY